ncbi:MAG: VWA domain-containing protein [Candidatus Heimdallarchaeota archaeon]|nr:VWA domain-containing protein [Candidatus Heimdallarchaeota archaeon]
MRQKQIKRYVCRFVIALFILATIFPVYLQCNLDLSLAIPTESSTLPINSTDILIELKKNSTGIGLHSSLKFTFNLTNTLQQSIYNLKAYSNQTSSDITLDQPLYEEFVLEPGAKKTFDVIAKITNNISSTSAVDLVIIIDASGSMGEEINSVKNKLNDLIMILSTEIPDLRIGAIVYGWREYSEYPASHLSNYLPFTSNFEDIKDFINSLYASGTYEPWGDALWLANSWNWREAANKLIIMVGDEDCDPGNLIGRDSIGDSWYNGSDLVEIVLELEGKGVIINTIVADNPDMHVANQFEWIAELTSGQSVYLPDMEEIGVDIPNLITEWTLELSREYSHSYNLTVTWENSNGTIYRNTAIDTFWLDLTPPSVTVSETIIKIGLNMYAVEFIAQVVDITSVNYVNLYYKGEGSWELTPMTLLPNSSNYWARIENLEGRYNLTYFVEAADGLGNSGTTPDKWIIVEEAPALLGKEYSLWMDPEEQSLTQFENNGTLNEFYLILSTEGNLNMVYVILIDLSTNSSIPLTQNYVVNASSSLNRQFFPLNLTTGLYALNITLSNDSEAFLFSYVWLKKIDVTKDRVSGTMTEDIRVHAYQWPNAIEGWFFSIVYEVNDPLVVYAEIYRTNLSWVGRFTGGSAQQIPVNGTYLIFIWATLRIGTYEIIHSKNPYVTDDPYRTTHTAQTPLPGFPVIITLSMISFLVIGRRKR